MYIVLKGKEFISLHLSEFSAKHAISLLVEEFAVGNGKDPDKRQPTYHCRQVAPEGLEADHLRTRIITQQITIQELTPLLF